jgi:hypothetical protein
LATPVQIFDGDMLYTVLQDCTIVFRALITGSVIDEPFGTSLNQQFSVKASSSPISRITPYGLYAITGFAEQAFPKLSTTAYSVHLEFSAPSFRSASINVAIPINATFPVAAPALSLQRFPLRVQGRIVADTSSRLPVAGALVLAVDGPGTTPGKHATALRTSLYADHAAGVNVEEIKVSVFATATLMEGTLPGATALTLSNRGGLAAGSILRLSNASKTTVEYCVLSSLAPGAGAGQVFLRHPLNRSYLSSVPNMVEFITTGAVAATAPLILAATSGDGVLIASQLFAGDVVVVIESGSPVAEYHQVGAISDVEGYYSFEGIGRLQQISFQASHTGFINLTQDWFLEFDHAVNIVDFRLQP